MKPEYKKEAMRAMNEMLTQVTSGKVSNQYLAMLTIRDALVASDLVSKTVASDIVTSMNINILDSTNWDNDMRHVVDLFAAIVVEACRKLIADEFDTRQSLINLVSQMTFEYNEYE